MSTRRRRRHTPDQIIRKLRDAEAMLNAGKDEAAVLQTLEVSEATYLRWRKQYGGMKADEAKRLTERRRFGDRRIARLLRREGWLATDTRVYRLRRREGLNVPQKKRKKRRLGSSDNGCHCVRTERADDVWCWDFVFDHTSRGTTLKWLSIVDESTRECLTLKVDRSITSEDVIDTLAELFAMRGVPRGIRSDNGPEFIARSLQRWLNHVAVETLFIEPASPRENGYAECFQSRFRDEFLAIEEFESLTVAHRLSTQWQHDDNHHRPHSALEYLTSVEFAARCTASTPEKSSAASQPSPPFQ